jgi:hypothetical protein
MRVNTAPRADTCWQAGRGMELQQGVTAKRQRGASGVAAAGDGWSSMDQHSSGYDSWATKDRQDGAEGTGQGRAAASLENSAAWPEDDLGWESSASSDVYESLQASGSTSSTSDSDEFLHPEQLGGSGDREQWAPAAEPPPADWDARAAPWQPPAAGGGSAESTGLPPLTPERALGFLLDSQFGGGGVRPLHLSATATPAEAAGRVFKESVEVGRRRSKGSDRWHFKTREAATYWPAAGAASHGLYCRLDVSHDILSFGDYPYEMINGAGV